jgi:hypothetical protein
MGCREAIQRRIELTGEPMNQFETIMAVLHTC